MHRSKIEISRRPVPNPGIVGCSHGSLFLMSPTVLRSFMNNSVAYPEVEFPSRSCNEKKKLPRRSNPKGKDRGKVIERELSIGSTAKSVHKFGKV